MGGFWETVGSGSGAGLGGWGLEGGPMSCGRLAGCAPEALGGWADDWTDDEAALSMLDEVLDDMLEDAALGSSALVGVELVGANPVAV